ncbi:hypothetical protein [Staphylococcus shinii]|uniref:hypothetical protein n=1 Tax=Staphylococcus shinii TaxID=2912228 RepID=UPI003F555EE7
MKKYLKILGVLSMSFIVLYGCGNNTESSSKEKSNDKQHTSSDKKNNSKNDKEDIKKIGFSDYINNGEHVFYKIDTGSMIASDLIAEGNEREGITIDTLGETTVDNTSVLKYIMATKDGETRDFNIDFNENDTYKFKNFTKYKGEELTNKLSNAEKNQDEDSDSSKVSNFVNPKKLLFVENKKANSIYYYFNNDVDMNEEKNKMKENSFSSNGYNTTIKPFKYNGKYYSGLAEANYNKIDEELTVNHILITEIDNKKQQIVLDGKDKFSDDEIIKYDDTEEAKEEQEKEKDDIDNL